MKKRNPFEEFIESDEFAQVWEGWKDFADVDGDPAPIDQDECDPRMNWEQFVKRMAPILLAKVNRENHPEDAFAELAIEILVESYWGSVSALAPEMQQALKHLRRLLVAMFFLGQETLKLDDQDDDGGGERM